MKRPARNPHHGIIIVARPIFPPGPSTSGQNALPGATPMSNKIPAVASDQCRGDINTPVNPSTPTSRYVSFNMGLPTPVATPLVLPKKVSFKPLLNAQIW